jgi:signal transduction histidine kinase
MKKNRQIRLAGLLMTVSWLLLFAFVIQWLVSRFDNEKEILRKELDRQFTEARLQVMDSTLIINLIDPMIREQQQMNIVMRSADSVFLYRNQACQAETLKRMEAKPSKRQQMYSITVTDSIPAKHHPGGSGGAFMADSGNLALHSIRLIVGQSIDTAANGSVFKQYLPREIDTAMFHKIFAEKLTRQGLDFTIHWPDATGSDSSQTEDPAILLSGKMFGDPIDATIGGFFWYLIQRIIPQIIFILLLVILTGSAFLFTFKSLKKQVMLNELRNDFIGNITHELKTPVATVKVALESLRSFDMKKDPAVTSEYLSMASLEMDRLEQLIGKVLNISALEENKQFVNPHPADLKILAERVVRSMAPRFEKENANVTFDAPEGVYFCLMDELFVEGVMVNLLDNSLKYAGENPKIRIRLAKEDNNMVLMISDNGPGIPEQFLHKVFDKFFRVPTGDKHNVKGHGLGLSYASEVMKQHRGTISVENLKEGGCVFRVVFEGIDKIPDI